MNIDNETPAYQRSLGALDSYAEYEKKQHINEVAKGILCAMVSANQPVVYYNEVFHKTLVDTDRIRHAFMIAEAFVERELK